MTIITPEQRQAVQDAGGSPIPVVDPVTGADYVLLPASSYKHLSELSEQAQDSQDRRAWSRLARGARDAWAKENEY